MSDISEDFDEVHHLEGPDAFRCAMTEAARATRRALALYSHSLDPTVYDRPELIAAISALARRHRLARVRLLVRDTRPLVSQGHGLIRLAQRLPSKVAIRQITDEPESQAPGFMLCDRDQLVYQNNPDQYRGFYEIRAPARVKTLTELFDRAWETATEDPRLRQLAL